MASEYVSIMFALCLLQVCNQLHAAILYRSPNNITVYVGATFNLSCGISYTAEDEHMAWIRFVNDRHVIISVGDYTYGPGKNRQKVIPVQDYTLAVEDATVSDGGLYQCGVLSELFYTPMANVSVTVLENLETTNIPTLITTFKPTSTSEFSTKMKSKQLSYFTSISFSRTSLATSDLWLTENRLKTTKYVSPVKLKSIFTEKRTLDASGNRFTLAPTTGNPAMSLNNSGKYNTGSHHLVFLVAVVPLLMLYK